MNTLLRPVHDTGRELALGAIMGAGLSISAALAPLYVFIMIASLILVGWMTDGSWLAMLLGIGWRTIIGFEIGLIVVVIAGFAAAAIFVPAWTLLHRRFRNQANFLEQPGQTKDRVARLQAISRLVIWLVLPGAALFVLHGLAPVFSSMAERNAAGAPGPGLPLSAHPENMGPIINSAVREAEPSFTADGRTMFYNCYNGDICVSHLKDTWEDGKWTQPERLGQLINTEYEEVEPAINPSGDKLYFNSNRPEGSIKDIPFLSPFLNILKVANTIANSKFGVSLLKGLGLGHVWVSFKINGAWSEPRLINEIPSEPPVNSVYHDHCLAFSPDGNKAFWTSTRPSGSGGNDIWTSRRVNDTWTAPENLGANVNSAGEEHHSIPTPDGKRLYVTSDRSGGNGGEDIYVTTRESDGTWGPLVNLGPEINGPGNDRCAAWTPDLKIFLFDSVRKGGFGGIDLWWMAFNK